MNRDQQISLKTRAKALEEVAQKQQELQTLATLKQQLAEEKQRTIDRRKHKLEECRKLILENEYQKLEKIKQKSKEQMEENEAIQRYNNYIGTFPFLFS